MKFVLALCMLVAISAAACNKLANCKTCKDDTHCDSCNEGYYLDGNDICRFKCSEKFGDKCPSCTEEKCICPNGRTWNGTQCITFTFCSKEEDGNACFDCGKGFDLIDVNRKCSKCTEAFGEGCETCSESKCLTPKEGYSISGAVAVKNDCGSNCPNTCAALFPGCTSCDSETNPTKCVTCIDTATLDGSYCKVSYPYCTNGTKWIVKDGQAVCGSCTADFDANCQLCDHLRCTRCIPGYALTADFHCISCSETFTDCLLCSADECTSCPSSRIKTPMGCLNQNPFVPEPEKSKAGMIAGIVVAVIILVALVIIGIYCLVTSNAKKGTIDPSLYEDDFDFKSMSVL